MAIPFCLPSDEETEDNYRRLEQLLADIYDVLRLILTRQQQQSLQINAVQTIHHNERVSSFNHRSQHQLQISEEEELPQRSSVDDVHCRLAQLPDLVLGTVSTDSNPQNAIIPSGNFDQTDGIVIELNPPCVPPRKHRKKSKKMSYSQISCEKSLTSSKPRSASGQSWINVGKELRNIAEDFRTTYKEANKGKEPTDLPELKASSLFALLLPSPLLNKSVWTTVLFIVGWRMLLRQR